MAKKLICYSRPKYVKGMSEEEKKQADDEHTKWLVKQIVANSGDMFGNLSEEEIDKILNEDLSDDFVYEEE